MKYLKKFESTSIEKEVLSYIRTCLNKDKKEYKYNWNDDNWLITEILQFLNRNHGSSYVFGYFFSKYNYDDLEKVLIDNFKKHFDEALEIHYNISLDEYLIKKETDKFNI